MFSTKVKSMYPKFTMAEKKIADYLVVNSGDVDGVTSHELAERLGVGQSTIIRFSKKMGYHMFGELIDDVQRTPAGDTSEVTESDSALEVLEKVGEQYRAVIDTVVKSNAGDGMERAAELVDRARTVVCYGYMNSHILADYLSEMLIELGKCSICSMDVVQTKRRIQQLDPERDTVIVVSKSGEKAEPCAIASFAAERGVPVIAIADATDNPLVRTADVHLKVLEISDRSTPAVSMGTSAGVMLVSEALVMSVFQRDRKRYQRDYGNSLVAALSERK